MIDRSNIVLPLITAWLNAEKSVESAVLFGSSARPASDIVTAWPDIDLHIVTNAVSRFEKTDWANVFPSNEFCLSIVRRATGGVNKITVVFREGEAEFVLVPASMLRIVRIGVWLGLHKKSRPMKNALNEFSTCIRTGYRFLKGESTWGKFYSKVATQFPGVRLNDIEACHFADLTLRELLWILRKLQAGEIIASQHMLHRTLVDTNLKLIRELRLRRGQPLPSFGLGRHAERLLTERELGWLRIDARLNREELRQASLNALVGLKGLMSELVPNWKVPDGMSKLIAEFAMPNSPTCFSC
jgi:hypothetical protein